MSPSLTNLPAELLAQIMCECAPDIKTVLRLSSMNRWARQVWNDNTVIVACAVFSFTRVELIAFMGLAKIEESPPEVMGENSTTDQPAQAPSASTKQPSLSDTVVKIQESRSEPALQQLRMKQLTEAIAAQSRMPETVEDGDLNSAVCDYLSCIERSAFGVRVVNESLERETATTTRTVTESPSYNETDLQRRQLSSCFNPHLIPAFLLVRGLAIGYNHPSILSAVYAAVHDCSFDDLDDVIDVGGILQEEECERHWDHIGIERQSGEATEWELNIDSHENITYLPRCWSFATYIVLVELNWRPEHPKSITYPEEEDEIHYRYSVLCEYFGSERLKLMLDGGDTLPWTEERHVARELFWQKKALDDPEEYQRRLARLRG
jgi:hypothetical protein